ncbi:hypothetical protein DB763_10435, partial [Xanthomonas perforans]
MVYPAGQLADAPSLAQGGIIFRDLRPTDGASRPAASAQSSPQQTRLTIVDNLLKQFAQSSQLAGGNAAY